MMRRPLWMSGAAIALAASAVISIFVLLSLDERIHVMTERTPAGDRSNIPLGVLGDSDSHSYQDGISFADDETARGGALRKRTLQWTEILARLRGDALDPGPWGAWGTRRGSIARVQDLFGLTSRFPRKEDYRYNFAISGAVCGDLMTGPRRQAPRLLALMEREPQRWRRGVVVIRIGTNSFGKVASLDQLARDPAAPDVAATIDACVTDIREAVALIRARHAQTRFVLVGIFDNAHWAKFFARWRSRAQLDNIAAGLSRFDDPLRGIAEADPGIAFFDDRAWFAQRWGSRGPDGRPAYRVLNFGRGFRVTNSLGDAPSNATLADGHAGTVWNALWAQSLVALMNERFAMDLSPLEERELVDLIDPDGSFAMR